jgi:hypothetical protein
MKGKFVPGDLYLDLHLNKKNNHNGMQLTELSANCLTNIIIFLCDTVVCTQHSEDISDEDTGAERERPALQENPVVWLQNPPLSSTL